MENRIDNIERHLCCICSCHFDSIFYVYLFCVHLGSKSADVDSDDSGETEKVTGEKVKCGYLDHTMPDGHLVCNGEEINSTCWTVCIEGYEKGNALIGSLQCEENGEWNGERTTCIKKDCGSLEQVVKTFRNKY